MKIWELLRQDTQDGLGAGGANRIAEAVPEVRAQVDTLLHDATERAELARCSTSCTPQPRQTPPARVPTIKAGWNTVKQPAKPKASKPPQQPRKPKVMHTIPTISSAPKALKLPGIASTR